MNSGFSSYSGSTSGFNAPSSLFSSSQNQTGGLFGSSTTPKPTSTTSSLFGSGSTTGFSFGSTTPTTTQTGTGNVKFSAFSGQDSVTKNGVQYTIQTSHQCITAMKEYEGKSLEELRLEDYQANRKFPQTTSGFGTSTGLFGFSTQSTSSGFGSSSLFNSSSTAAKPFGGFDSSTITITPSTSTGFGLTQPSTGLFGTSSAHITSTSPIVSANPSFSTTGGLFGSSTQHNHQQKSLFNADISSSHFPSFHSPSKTNISIFDLMKTQFRSNENLNIDEKLSEIDVTIILPCGFTVKYDKKVFKKTSFECPVCKNHSISSQDCLNMERNKLVLVERLLELKKQIFEEMRKKIEGYTNDPNHYIEDCYYKTINDIDIRKEEIKSKFNEQIDKYCNDLLEEVQKEKVTKENKVNEKIKDLDLTKKAIDSMKIDQSLDVYSRINILKNNNISIDNGIDLVSKFEDYLTESKFKLTDGSKDIDLGNLFGELYLREKTSNIFDIDEICEKNRTEATIQLVINDISKFENSNNLNVYSKRCRVGNFEWSIYIKFICNDNREKKLGFYLQCNSIEGLSKFPVDVHAQFTLVDRINPNNNLTNSKNFTFAYQTSQGFDCFIEFNKFLDLINSYYNNIEDSMTFKVYIKESGFKGGFIGGFSTQGNQTTSLFEGKHNLESIFKSEEGSRNCQSFWHLNKPNTIKCDACSQDKTEKNEKNYVKIVKTGEEDEETLFKQRCKLSRFDFVAKEWKEKGIGEIKILKHKIKENNFRVLMRREKVLKLCANHCIASEIKHDVKYDNQNQVSWLACDFSEGAPQTEFLAAKFRLENDAKKFFLEFVNSTKISRNSHFKETINALELLSII